MDFRHPRPLRPLNAADLAPDASARLRNSARPAFKANMFAFAARCALAGAAVLMAGPVMAAESATSATSQEYAISPGRLSDVLAQFAATSGVPLSFDPQMLTGLHSTGLKGRYSVREGFSYLLTGSGYELTETSGAGYSLRQVPATTGQSSATGETDGVVELAPVTVTPTLYGSRTTNSLGDSMASIGIVTAKDIENSQIRGVRDTFRRMGNVMNGDWTDNGFVIRGVNSEGLVPGGAPLASIYIDGIQQNTFGARRGALGLWDVEQAELYRGPQSTLSGRAAMAGALHIKTKDPVFAREAEISGTLGTGGLAGTAFMVNTPIPGDQIAIRISGEFRRSKNDINYPTFTDFSRYKEFTRHDYYQLRGKALFLPTALPDTQALLTYSFSHDDPYVRDIGGPALGFDFGAERGDFQEPAFIEYRPTNVHNAGLQITHDFSDSLRFTSQSSLTYADVMRASPNYGTAGQINTYNGYYKNFLASQEFRLNHEGERLDWVAGVHGSYEHEKNQYHRTTGSYTKQTQYKTQKTSNLALFGEATYEFVPSWKITLGGRVDYTNQDSTEHLQRTRPLGGTTTVMTDFAARFDEFNFVPKIGISKALTENQTVGATYSKGFRTGGAGYDATSLTTYTYEPEKATTYELFYKGRFLEDRLALNANLFHTSYKNQQVRARLAAFDYTTLRILNAGSGEAWGFEVEPTFRVTDQLDTFLSLGYTHTEFKEFDSATYGKLAGMPFPEAPEWTIGFGGRYTFQNGIHMGADAKYTSGYLARLGSLPHDYIDSRWVANLQLGYRTDAWEVNAFVDNLFDNKYFVYNDNDIAATLGEYRKVGVNFKVKL